MAGQRAMRTAANFITAGIRGVQPLNQSVSTASLDADDWEVADAIEAEEPTSKLVFGDVPNFNEAEAATTELKHAIDMIYLSSNSGGCKGSPGSQVQVSVLSPSHSDQLENKSSIMEAISNPSANRALQAFQLLSESHEAQSVVASIACDPNIWNAIVQNPALQDFFHSKQTVVAGFEAEGISKNVKLPNYCDSGYGFVDSLSILHNMKLTVAEMVSIVSNYLNNILGFTIGQNSSAGGNTKENLMDPTAMGGTFMLAVLVVMVIVLKRA